MRRTGWWLCIVLTLCTWRAAFAWPPNFISTPVGDSWDQAVGLSFAADGRMLVWEKAGRVWTVENGVRDSLPLIDIHDEVGDWRDYGLLGFALDPDFLNNGYIYLLYVVDYHHLLFFGTPNYDPNADWYFHDTIGRITRYTCNAADGFHSVDYGSRLVLVGESMSSGFPMCHQSHGIGSLVFGEDGTLMASCGDGASYEEMDNGGCRDGSSCTCLSDGIIDRAQDVGAFRSQLLDGLNGKIIRIDPATGDGISSNPFFDAANPRAAKSRVWALGFRNPFRMTFRPGTGSANPADADPGTLYVGDVGWNAWEELSIVKQGGMNFGWPLYEGLEQQPEYAANAPGNLHAPNPLFGTTPPGQGLCTQQYFDFDDLLIQDSLNPSSFPNPCDPSQQIPASVPKFMHLRPVFDWQHGSGPARTGIYTGNTADVVNIGAPSSPVPGPQFGGNCAIGGAWYLGSDFPLPYQNSYYHADFGATWLRQFLFDNGDNPLEVRDFAPEGTEAFVGLAADPVNGGLYSVGYDQAGCCMIQYIHWVPNTPPIAVGAANPYFGPSPLTVQFDGSNSYDPDDPNHTQSLTYEWDFDDGTPHSREANPIHIYPTEDITATGSFIGKIFSLNPPHPIGGGNWDPEVMRDGDYPPVGNQDSARQYDTYHQGNQGNDDWIGYLFPRTRRFRELVFQEGIQFFDGGWFDSLSVEVRVGGNWAPVTHPTVTPNYAANNGIAYESYEFRFDPIVGDAIRIHGQPGGSANFISVGELRVLAEPLTPVTTPTAYVATLTVTDALGGSGQTNITISINNTPPQVMITSPLDGSSWPAVESTVPLTADIHDDEQTNDQLSCQWQAILHHNDHVHPEPYDHNCISQTTITPLDVTDALYYYETELMVSDSAGLSTTKSSFIFPPYIPWHAAVYYDSRYPSAWTSGTTMRDALAARGFEVVDADQLKLWMNAQIALEAASVVVFSQDIAPDTIIEAMDASCTLRQYLDSDGKVIWYSDIPLYYRGHNDGTFDVWGIAGSQTILGFNAAAGQWDLGDTVSLTSDGITWGLFQQWQSRRPAVSVGLRPLALNSRGEYSAWVKPYIARDVIRGFVRFFDRVGVPDPDDLVKLAFYPVGPCNTEPCLVPPPPAPLADDTGISKPRYVSMRIPTTVAATASDPATALSVKLTSLMHPDPPNLPQFPAPDFSSAEGQIRWVGPVSNCVESQLTGETFKCARLQCNPYYTDWGMVAGSELLHVSGRELVPSSTYAVERLASACQGNEPACTAVSMPLRIATSRWGDVVAPFQSPVPAPLNQPDIRDVAALVDKFRALPTAIIVARADLDPQDPNQNVNIADIANTVDAFKGFPFPFHGPASCP